MGMPAESRCLIYRHVVSYPAGCRPHSDGLRLRVRVRPGAGA